MNLYVGLTALLVISATRGCHYSDDESDGYEDRRRKRQATTEVDKTKLLRDFFVSCMRNKLGQLFDSWGSVIDFTVLDTRWYQNSDLDFCLAGTEADSTECWKERLKKFVKNDSSLAVPSAQCIEEYNIILRQEYSEDNDCERGGWTPFFYVDSNDKAVGLRNFHESFPGVICESPNIIEAQLQNTSNNKQKVKVSTDGSFQCSNKGRGKGKSCKDYTFRFCCPNLQEQYPDCEDGEWTPFFDNHQNRNSGDFELLATARLSKNGKSICAFPSAIDVRLVDGRDYRVVNQVVSLSLREGFQCRNSDQLEGRTCLNYKVRYCCPKVHTHGNLIRRIRQVSFAPSEELISSYENCISRNTILPSYRSPLDYSSLITLIDEHLLCNVSGPGDCFSNASIQYPNAVSTWPYRFEALSKDDSPLTRVLAECNDLVFPLEEIQGGWGTWSSWDNCPSRCGESGKQLRRRTCLDGPAGIPSCLGSIHEIRLCRPDNCPFFTEWSNWSVCSNNRPGENRRRSRICENGNPVTPGCQGPTEQVERCDGCVGNRCNDFSRWGTWDACSAHCGSGFGVRRRRRYCTTGLAHRCQGSTEQREECQAENCPSWTAWGQWNGVCSTACTITQRTRMRSCLLRGAFRHECQGESQETETCEMPPNCSTDYGFLSPWSNFEPCPAQCGHISFHVRRRHCTNGPNGGPGCTAPIIDRKECQADNCPKWSNWRQWSRCSQSCGTSRRTRNRLCLLKGNLHHNCPGASAASEPCDAPRCTNDDEFLSQWSEYGQCIAPCGQKSSHSRTRTCTSGPNGGPGCTAILQQTKECTRNCARWGQWTAFGSCPVTCGSGMRTRTRACVGGNRGDEGCRGTHLDTQTCQAHLPCSNLNTDFNRQAGFSSWSTWGYCSAQCRQFGTRIRRRHCRTGPPGSPGCVGLLHDTEQCMKSCGTWSEWTRFSDCDASCGTSTHSRSRTCIGGIVGQDGCYGQAFDSRQCYTGRPC